VRKNSIKFLVFAVLIVQFYIIFFLNPDKKLNENLASQFKPDKIKVKPDDDQELNLVITRDFKRYKCANRIRVGGMKEKVQAARDELYDKAHL
jgi:hypothetical protein